MNPISIVLYQPELAAAVADMWNISRDSWGGGNSISTAEQIRQEEANSDALYVYLAMDGDAVVGYCSLGEYREDTGALYVQLLNVSPDYHGKKVGRMLLDRALAQTIQLGWPRLDLYTWAGNTKAVPLYKKFGFFWEDRDDTTHLMNMIPTVLRTEAIAHYFEELDWYKDSTREIAIEPDGRKENGFDYFTYSWSKETTNLRVEFERFGRGMRLIETNDYLLSAEVEKHELVFGREYQMNYHIVNKSGKPLHLTLKGENNENIRFHYEAELEVIGEQTLSASFFVDPINEEQNVWRTHPRVCTNILINGQSALFQIGIAPKFPATLSMQVQGLSYPGQTAQFYLDVKNNFTEEAEFSFELPSRSFLELGMQTHTLRLAGKQRISLPLSAKILEHGFYEADVQVEAKLSDGSSVLFAKKIGAAFTGLGAMLSGETEQKWQVHHGRFTLSLNKNDNKITISSSHMSPSFLSIPKLGKPYSSEFSKKRAEHVVFSNENGAIGLIATYRSSSFAHIELISKTLLFGDGTVEQRLEITNLSSVKMAAELWLTQGFAHQLHHPILPYQGHYVEVNASYGSDFDYWDAELMTENWLFSRDEEAPWGICWPEDYDIDIKSWEIGLETNLGLMMPNSTKTYGPVYLTHGGFTSWKEFRAFACKDALSADVCLTSHLELNVNDSNPFVAGEVVDIKVKEYKQQFLDGQLTASLQDSSTAAQSLHFAESDEQTESSFSFTATGAPFELIHVDGHFATHKTQIRSAIFPIGQGEVMQQFAEEQGQQVLIADNGILRIKAAPQFSSALYSLTSNGQEWLATSFPKPQPKSWWNPWIGGIGNHVEGMNAFSLAKEDCTAAFTTLTDNKKNVWQGIKLSYQVQKQEKYRGLTCHQYFLLLPGVPVLCHTVQIEQNTGTYFADKDWMTDIFLQTEDAQEPFELKTIGESGEQLRYTIGKGELDVNEVSDYIVCSASRKDQMHIVTDLHTAELTAYSNKEVACASIKRELNLPNESVMFTAPVFFLFADQVIPSDSLSALRTIRFAHEGIVTDENN